MLHLLQFLYSVYIYKVFTYMFLYTCYKLYNNESQFFCAIKSQFFVFLLKFGKMVAYRRVRLCRFTTKQGGMQRRPAAKRERAGRRARRRIICGIQRRFARILRIRYTKKRSFFAKNGRRLCKFFARIVLIHAQFRQGKRRPNSGSPLDGQTKTVRGDRPARYSVYCMPSPG